VNQGSRAAEGGEWPVLHQRKGRKGRKGKTGKKKGRQRRVPIHNLTGPNGHKGGNRRSVGQSRQLSHVYRSKKKTGLTPTRDRETAGVRNEVRRVFKLRVHVPQRKREECHTVEGHRAGQKLQNLGETKFTKKEKKPGERRKGGRKKLSRNASNGFFQRREAR